MNEEVTMQGQALYIFYRSINLNEEHFPLFFLWGVVGNDLG